MDASRVVGGIGDVFVVWIRLRRIEGVVCEPRLSTLSALFKLETVASSAVGSMVVSTWLSELSTCSVQIGSTE